MQIGLHITRNLQQMRDINNEWWTNDSICVKSDITFMHVRLFLVLLPKWKQRACDFIAAFLLIYNWYCIAR